MPRTVEEMVEVLADLFDEIAEQPMTEEEVDAELRAYGYEPAELASRFRVYLAEMLMDAQRRMIMQTSTTERNTLYGQLNKLDKALDDLAAVLFLPIENAAELKAPSPQRPLERLAQGLSTLEERVSRLQELTVAAREIISLIG